MRILEKSLLGNLFNKRFPDEGKFLLLFQTRISHTDTHTHKTRMTMH